VTLPNLILTLFHTKTYPYPIPNPDSNRDHNPYF